AAVVTMGGAAVAAAILAPKHRRGWMGIGVVYAGAMVTAPVVLRADEEFGFVSMIYLFVVVWTTDILAYFVGRRIGGPKLVPAVSPNKTWSGAIGGAGSAVVGGLLVGGVAGVSNLSALIA